MQIKEITNQSVWQQFINESQSFSFLQSWEWGEVEEKMGYDIIHLGLYEGSRLQAIALVIKIRAKRGNFLFIPHGPIFTEHETCNIKHLKSSISQLLNYLIILSKKEGYSFIRIAPILENRGEHREIFEDLGFTAAPIYMHAERVWILPLVTTSGRPHESCTFRTDEELLSSMRKTTRYLIKKAARDGAEIERRTDQKAVDDFYKIYKETAKRENFIPFSKDYIKNEFEAFQKTGNALFLFARLPLILNAKNTDSKHISRVATNFRNNERLTGLMHVREDVFERSSYLASALIIFTKSTAFYHQGASIHTKVPVTYLLQWEAIKEARQRGCQFYNFWGIYQQGRTPKSWQGLTLFKTGFGGYKYQYLPTQDHVISPTYYLTYVYETFLQWKRGV